MSPYCLVMGMQLKFWRGELKLTHQWTIARGSASKFRVVFVELKDRDGVIGYGETAPSRRYQETIETVEAFFSHIHPQKLNFSDIPASKAYLDQMAVAGGTDVDGHAYYADNPDQLKAALEGIFHDIGAGRYSFSLPSISSYRDENSLYISSF
ncbi:MAG: hypothetical protein ACXW32_12000, partial [Limisphaerales bacterium]